MARRAVVGKDHSARGNNILQQAGVGLDLVELLELVDLRCGYGPPLLRGRDLLGNNSALVGAQ